MASKARDTKNYRKGKDIKVGDIVEMVQLDAQGRVDYSVPAEFRRVSTITMDRRNYRMWSDDGRTGCVCGHQYAKGQFE